MGIETDIIFVCAFYLALAPEWKTTFTRKDTVGEIIHRACKKEQSIPDLSLGNQFANSIRKDREPYTMLIEDILGVCAYKKG
jgi:hypothetical protein